MPDASLYATVAYLLTALVLAGYAGRLILRGRWVEGRLREMKRSGTPGHSDAREPAHDVPEVSRV